MALLGLVADSALAGGRYQEALVLYRQLATLAPADGKVRYNLARTYAATGDGDNYRSALAEAVRLGPYQHAVRLEFRKSLIRSKSVFRGCGST